jgi:hypothetical protein
MDRRRETRLMVCPKVTTSLERSPGLLALEW